MSLIISIQSQVVMGHVGNSAAVFPLLAAGHQVAAVPTVILSNIPEYPTLRGRPLPEDFLAELLQGLWDRELPQRAEFLLSGYLGTAGNARLLADFVARAKAENPGLRYYCDPVLGDDDPGLYVPAEIAHILRDQLLPLADLASPNGFELAWLTGTSVHNLRDVDRAARQLQLAAGAQLIVTGCTLADTAPGMIETLILDHQGIIRHPAPRLPVALAGTGDLFAALVTASLAKGQDLNQAVAFAQAQTARALAEGARLGQREIALSDPQFRAALLG